MTRSRPTIAASPVPTTTTHALRPLQCWIVLLYPRLSCTLRMILSFASCLKPAARFWRIPTSPLWKLTTAVTARSWLLETVTTATGRSGRLWNSCGRCDTRVEKTLAAVPVGRNLSLSPIQSLSNAISCEDRDDCHHLSGTRYRAAVGTGLATTPYGLRQRFLSRSRPSHNRATR